MRAMDDRNNVPTDYVYRDALSLPSASDLFAENDAWADVLIEAPGVVRSFERKRPEFLDDPDNTGLFSELSSAIFYSPPAFVARARRARVVGFRTVLTNDGSFFNDDSEMDEKSRLNFLNALSMPDPRNEETGLRRLGDSESFVLDRRGRTTHPIPGFTVLLSSAEPSNYGSWLFRVLPKIQTLQRFNLDQNIKFLVWAGLPTFREYLEVLGIPANRVILHDPTNVVYQLERLIVPSMRNNQAFLDAESLALFSRMRTEFGGPQESGKRIYVSRLSQSQLGSSRAMQNEAELIERLKGMAFHIVNPEKLSVREQVRVFSSASMVVGPSGSGMFNVVFCHPGTKVIDIESEPHWIHAHLCLFSSCSLRYGIFMGKAVDSNFTDHHKPWTVNIKALTGRIDSFSTS